MPSIKTQHPAGGPGAEEVLLGGKLPSFNSTPRVRLQYVAERLHSLGPKPLFHFLDEVERGTDLRTHLEEYSTLPPEFIKAYVGDKFGPIAFLVKGSEQP